MNKLLLSFLLLLPAVSLAETSGEVAYEFRKFEDDAKDATVDTGHAIASKVAVKSEYMGYEYRIKATARTDAKDKERGYIAIEDAYIFTTFGEEESLTFYFGYKTFNWSATEAFHPADVINSRNYDGELESLEKKGELTLELQKEFEMGSMHFFFWPRFERPIFPGQNSRLGSGIDLGRAVVIDGADATSNEQWQNQFGVQVNLVFDSIDISGHFIHHVDRLMPLFGVHDYITEISVGGNVQQVNIPNSTEFAPHYYKVSQLGGTFQWALNTMMIKFEGAFRSFEKDFFVMVASSGKSGTFETRVQEDHAELAAGLEIPFNIPGGTELTFFLEGQMITGVDEVDRVYLSVFQKDVMAAFRYVLNDVMGTEFYASFITDLERENESILSASMSRRLTDDWKFKQGFRYFNAPIKEETAAGLEVYDGDHYYYFNLIKYF